MNASVALVHSRWGTLRNRKRLRDGCVRKPSGEEGMAESWSVVRKSEDGGLVDSHEDVDLDDLPGQTGERSLFNDSLKAHFGEDGSSPTQTAQHREARNEDQYRERGQSNPTSQQDNQSPSTEQVPPGTQPANPQEAGSRPSTLFEPGSMVEVKEYGFGVVQWLGQLEGRETAGVELVCAPYIVVGEGEGGCSECYIHRRRSTGSSVEMVLLMEETQCCSHANQDMLSSLL